MTQRFRSRSGTLPELIYGYSGYCNPKYSVPTTLTPQKRIIQSQTQYDFLDRCWDFLNPGPPYREGHGLRIEKCTNDGWINVVSGTWWYNGGRYYYSGEIPCTSTYLSVFGQDCLTPSSFAELAWEDPLSYGASGWNKARPGKPTADLALFLAEIRDVPRMLKDTAKFFKNSWTAFTKGGQHVSKHAANSWLGANFGWLPFISDMRKFARTTQTLDKSIQQLKRDNGKWVRRRRTVSTTLETLSDTGWVNNQPYHGSGFNSTAYVGLPNMRGRCTIERAADFWFEAAFRYWIPDIGTSNWRRKAIRKLYGLDLTPSLLWEATPFSWLVDWYSNVGDVISNLDNNLAENLVAKYAYVMGTQRLIGSVSTEFNFKPEVTCPKTHINHLNVLLKERHHASPFGFALSSDNFTARQWSLLAALGIQRLPLLR